MQKLGQTSFWINMKKLGQTSVVINMKKLGQTSVLKTRRNSDRNKQVYR